MTSASNSLPRERNTVLSSSSPCAAMVTLKLSFLRWDVTDFGELGMVPSVTDVANHDQFAGEVFGFRIIPEENRELRGRTNTEVE
jgi:hypothetical protein